MLNPPKPEFTSGLAAPVVAKTPLSTVHEITRNYLGIFVLVGVLSRMFEFNFEVQQVELVFAPEERDVYSYLAWKSRLRSYGA